MAEPEDKDNESIKDEKVVDEASEKAAFETEAELKTDQDPGEIPAEAGPVSIEDLLAAGGNEEQAAEPEDKDNQAVENEASGEETHEIEASESEGEINADPGAGEIPTEAGPSIEELFQSSGQASEAEPAGSDAFERATFETEAELKTDQGPGVPAGPSFVEDLFAAAGNETQSAEPEDKENEITANEGAGGEISEEESKWNADPGPDGSSVENGPFPAEEPPLKQVDEAQVDADKPDAVERAETDRDEASEAEAELQAEPGEILIESGAPSTEGLPSTTEQVDEAKKEQSSPKLSLLKVLTGLIGPVRKKLGALLQAPLSVLSRARVIFGKGIQIALPHSIWTFIKEKRKLIVVCSICLAGLVAVFVGVRLGQRYYSGSKSLLGKADILAGIQGQAVTMKPFLIAFDRSDTDVFLRMELNLVVDDNDERVVREIKAKELVLREAIYVFFATKELPFVKKGNKDKHLSEELCRTVNAYLKNGKVQRIVFSEYAFV